MIQQLCQDETLYLAKMVQQLCQDETLTGKMHEAHLCASFLLK